MARDASQAGRRPRPGLYQGGGRGRIDLLNEMFADATNPIWDVFNRSAGIDAIGRYRELANGERQELFGAATGAIWMRG